MEGEKKNNLDNENILREVEDSGQHSDNTLFSKGYSSPINNHNEESSNMDFDRKHDIVVEARVGNDVPLTNFILICNNLEDPVGVPPEGNIEMIASLEFTIVAAGPCDVVARGCFGAAESPIVVAGCFFGEFCQFDPLFNDRVLCYLHAFFHHGGEEWQILQLVMEEDAIDDWLRRQIHWLWREEIIAKGFGGSKM
ncbi:hypothetical protein VNO78_13155 [Psophocarpus tetragonolobus]|uniref:Uncharacterized protein n=1 Tax=Psophocarpus tetragonolobus TaxID=3891 RepID=A0AAN9SNW9_PSOTE